MVPEVEFQSSVFQIFQLLERLEPLEPNFWNHETVEPLEPTTYISTWTPSSTTRSGGSLK